MIYEVKVAAKNYRLELKPADTDRSSARWLCLVEGREIQIDVARIDDSTLWLLIAGVSYTVHRDSSAQGIRIWIGKPAGMSNSRTHARGVAGGSSLIKKPARLNYSPLCLGKWSGFWFEKTTKLERETESWLWKR